MLLTVQIVHNLVKEIIEGFVRKNWVSSFVVCYRDEISSVYLRNMGYKRIKAESELVF